MNLTHREKEAFYRGKAAGIIPADCPMPENGEEMDNLILHIGPMYSRTVGCRNQTGKLFFVDISVFSQKHLEATVRRLPELLAEVSEVTPLQIEEYRSLLAELDNYFSLGSGIIDEADLASRLTPVTAAEIRKGFEFKYRPEKIAGLATPEQRMALSDMVMQDKIPPFCRRQWENLTGQEAAKLIRNNAVPEKEISKRVRLMADEYAKLTPEDKIRFKEMIT